MTHVFQGGPATPAQDAEPIGHRRVEVEVIAVGGASPADGHDCGCGGDRPGCHKNGGAGCHADAEQGPGYAEPAPELELGEGGADPADGGRIAGVTDSALGLPGGGGGAGSGG